MDLKQYYEEVVKTAGLVGPSEEETKEAIAALEAAAEGDESVDVDAVEEFLKTAGLLTNEEGSEEETSEEPSEEKVAAVNAVSEQFDIDGIKFDSEDEKVAAAVAIVEGFEKTAMDADQRFAMKASIAKQRAKEKAEKSIGNRFRKAGSKAKDLLSRVGSKAKELASKADTKLHGSNNAKKFGLSVKNWRRAATGGALAAAAGGAAYLKSRKNK